MSNEKSIEIPDLPYNQIVWVFDQAQEHFAKLIAEHETEIMRHSFFEGTPLLNKSMDLDRKDRVARVADLRRYIANYTDVLKWVNAMRKFANDQHMQDSAQGFAAFFTERFGPKKATKATKKAKKAPKQ